MAHVKNIFQVTPALTQLLSSVCRSTAAQSAINLQQRRSVVIVRRRERKRENKRWVKTDLENPFKEKEELYEFVEDTQHQATKTIKVILTEDVPGVGLKDDIVAARKGLVRNKLIPRELAVYASLENLKERASRLQEDASGPKRLSLLAQETIHHMQSKPLRLVLHEDQEWEVLPKEPILQAFKKDGVFVPEYALELPDEPITEFGVYQLQVTVNGVKTVPVEMHLIKKEREKVDDVALDDI
ncbi:large ribosomal subunit protein bL9m-like isoform X2 [Apostichopus japonicus]